MKKGLLLMVMLAILSCKNKDTEVESTLDLTPKEVVNSEEDEVEAVEKTLFPREEKVVLTIITPDYYDIYETGSPADNMNENWLQLENKKGLFQVTKAKFAVSENHNECTGMDQVGIFSPEELEPVFFLAPNKLITKGTKVSLSFSDAPLWPSNPQEYLFNGKKYTMRAEGKESASYDYTEDDSGKVKKYKAFSNYKLYISVGDEEQLVLEIPGFNDTFIKLLFVGDLDGDGNLDFIFDTSADYEIQSTEVYLSKGAKHFLYLAGENAVDFSC